MHEETGARIKILIADDDKVIADILKELISNQDRSVEVCHDGLEASEKIQNDGFDLIVVDLIMPGMGGLEVLKYAKKINPDIIVIIITGYASLETAITAIKEGAYDYIRKPCKLAEMKIVVDRATEKIRLDRENKELLRKLQDADQKLIVQKTGKNEYAKMTSIPFFSSDIVELNYLANSPPVSNLIDKLHALSTLKENGSLTEREFKVFKKHLLEMIDLQDTQKRFMHG
jgi:CheY-like chemotaxis protein